MSQTQCLFHPIADVAIENLWWGSSELTSTLHWWHFLMQPRRKYQTSLLGLISSRPASAVRYPRLRSQLNCEAYLWTGCSCIIKAVPSGKVAVYYSNLKKLWLEPECSALTVVFAERKVLLGGIRRKDVLICRWKYFSWRCFIFFKMFRTARLGYLVLKESVKSKLEAIC